MTRNPSLRASRFGLTLMELVVVLVILIALASVLLPMLPAFLTKTHDAVTTTNISETDKGITGFFMANLAYPNQFDSLVDASGNMYAGLIFNPLNPISQNTFSPVGTVATTGNGTQAIYTGTLSAGQATSLTLGGITSLMVMSTSTVSPPAFNATFPNPGGAGPYVGMPGTTGATVGVSSTMLGVLFADNNYIFQKLNIAPKLDSNGNPCNYVVLGLGPYCTIVGASSFGIFDAPVAFGEHYFEQPIVSYSRYLCVFRVYSDGTRCEYVGSAHDDATGLGTYDMHMQEYYQTTN
jgi:Tfp pilus assembly protein PilE